MTYADTILQGLNRLRQELSVAVEGNDHVLAENLRKAIATQWDSYTALTGDVD